MIALEDEHSGSIRLSSGSRDPDSGLVSAPLRPIPVRPLPAAQHPAARSALWPASLPAGRASY